MQKNKITRIHVFLAAVSGIMLTASFPRTGLFWLAWFSLLPLLYALKNLPGNERFRLGLLTGLVHYLTLIYWLVHTMRTYGYLPLYLSVIILLLLSFYLALYIAVFSVAAPILCSKPRTLLFIGPFLWVALEYVRSFLFSGFPWELLGYSQYPWLSIIQISDIAGVYGVSFLILFSNMAFFITILHFSKKKWQNGTVSKKLAAASIFSLVLIIALSFFYGKWRITSVNKMISESASSRIAIVQGNIEQSEKWDDKFRRSTTEKYIDLSMKLSSDKPELVVWPETATPFYFFYDPVLSQMVLDSIQETDAYFLIGSPSFVRNGRIAEYYNSAYLISPDGIPFGKYDKAHLVPFGEYVPLRRWLPFIGKIVAGVGDFMPGPKGNVLEWKDAHLGVLICYEMIFPELSRAMVKNNASLLLNITNDAWYGVSSAPYQHFSMAVFRAVENKRTLIRSANTGISGFIHPTGRIMAKTGIFQDATLTKTVPVLKEISFYTRYGDIFALLCSIVCAITLLSQIKKSAINKNSKKKLMVL
ncbi:MAG: apolipoprotein N-acyltransferase [Deltaproteobacteria bacterium]|nr:apolipoprotein N-acyltransferase [Deltaproteobacteria bacterium]